MSRVSRLAAPKTTIEMTAIAAAIVLLAAPAFSQVVIVDPINDPNTVFAIGEWGPAGGIAAVGALPIPDDWIVGATFFTIVLPPAFDFIVFEFNHVTNPHAGEGAPPVAFSPIVNTAVVPIAAAPYVMVVDVAHPGLGHIDRYVISLWRTSPTTGVFHLLGRHDPPLGWGLGGPVNVRRTIPRAGEPQPNRGVPRGLQRRSGGASDPGSGGGYDSGTSPKDLKPRPAGAPSFGRVVVSEEAFYFIERAGPGQTLGMVGGLAGMIVGKPPFPARSSRERVRLVDLPQGDLNAHSWLLGDDDMAQLSEALVEVLEKNRVPRITMPMLSLARVKTAERTFDIDRGRSKKADARAFLGEAGYPVD